jgi:translocation and assembly module TamB
MRRWVVRPFVWLLLLLVVIVAAVVLFVQTPLAHERALALIIARSSEYLGRQIQVGRVDYDFYPLAFEAHDVVVPGPRPGDPAVARAPFVRVEFSWRDLRQRVLRLEHLQIERPEIYLQFNPDGTNNLPDFRTRRRTGPQRVEFQLGSIAVQNGTLRINERKLPLHLEAKSIWGRAEGRGDEEGRGFARLDALFTAQEVVTTLPRARPYTATVSLKGSLLPRQGRVQIANARFAGPDLSASARGFLDYRRENRRMELRFDAQAAARLANRLGYMEEPIEGPVDFTGRFTLEKEDWDWSGTAASPRLAVLDRVFEEVSADLTGTREGVDAVLERVRYAEGTVRGDIRVDTRGDAPGTPVETDLTFDGLSLAPLIADQFPGRDLPVVGGLSGRASGTFEYRFNTEDPLAGSGGGLIQVRGTSERGRLPISGEIPVTLDDGVVSIASVRLTAPGQDVVIRDLTLDLEPTRGQLDYRLVSTDLAPLAPLLADPPAPGEEPAFWLPSRGRGVAEGRLTFAGEDFTMRVGLDLQDVIAPATPADTVRGSFTLSSRAIDDLRLELTRGRGALAVSGRVPLPEEGRAVASQPLALAVQVSEWPVQGMGLIFPAAVVDAVSGRVSGRVDLGGFPERLTGRAEADVRDLAVSGHRIGRARADVAFNGGHIVIEQALIQGPAGSVLTRGSFDQATEAFDFTLDAPALALAQEPLRGLLPDLAGRMEVAASGSGTLARPELTVSVRGRELAFRGRPIDGDGATQILATWSGAAVQVEGSLLGLASFSGGGRLDREGADVNLDLRSDRLGAVARLVSPRPLPDFSGSLAGTLEVAADFSESAYRGVVRLPELRLQSEGRTISNLETVVVELSPEEIDVRSLYLGEPGTGSELFVAGTVGLAEGAPLDLRFQSTVSAAWAELALPEWEVEGALDLLGAVRGTASNPLLSGQGEVRGGRVIAPDFAQTFEEVAGFVSFNRDRVELEELRARLGGGTLRANGLLTLPAEGRALSYRVNVAANDVSVRFPEMLLNRGDAEVAILSTEGGRQIVGQIDLERSLYVEDVRLELPQLLQGALQRGRLEVPETDPFLAETELNLLVNGPDALRVRNNVANLAGDVSLAVRGTLARPVLFGEVELDPGGTLVYNDNEYEVERGTLTFSNPNRIDPVIDLVARTEIQDFEITLNFGGTFEQPDINFASDANLADLEIVSLIATGERYEEEDRSLGQAGEQVAAGQVASQFLAGQAASALGKRVGTLFGFDRFRIEPLAEAGQPISSVGVTVGKRLSRDVFVTYSSDPTSNRQYVVQVEWQVRSNLTLLLTQVGDGSYAIDAQWERRF